MTKTTSPETWTIGRVGGTGIVGPVMGSIRYASASVDWQPTELKGFWMKPLFEDAERGEKTLLMKVDPGAWSPMHTHPGELEQIYVLEGSLLRPGCDYGTRRLLLSCAGRGTRGGIERRGDPAPRLHQTVKPMLRRCLHEAAERRRGQRMPGGEGGQENMASKPYQASDEI